MAYGKIKADTLVYDNNGSDVEKTVASLAASAPTNNPTFTGTINGAALTLSGDLTVNGTTTTIDSTTLTVEDKNIELGKVDTPTDTTADGGGITLKGATDKTITWTDATNSWDFNQDIKITGRIIGAKDGNSTLSTPSLELYGSQSGATYGDLRVHNWGDSSGDYWRINSNLGLDNNGNTDKVDDSKKGAAITIDGRAGRVSLQTSHDGTSNTHDVLIADSSGNATFGGTVSDSKGDVRSIPSNVKSSAYTLVASDAGKAIYISSGGITVANSVFSDGDAVTIINNSGSDQTITQGSGVTIYNAADAATGNRTLSGRGVATLLFSSASAAYISGGGLT